MEKWNGLREVFTAFLQYFSIWVIFLGLPNFFHFQYHYKNISMFPVGWTMVRTLGRVVQIPWMTKTVCCSFDSRNKMVQQPCDPSPCKAKAVDTDYKHFPTNLNRSIASMTTLCQFKTFRLMGICLISSYLVFIARHEWMKKALSCSQTW